MNALEFINERNRMCKASECCHDCFANRNGCIFNYPANNNAKEQVKVVEEWSAEHPRKTRQSVFLEQYPEAYVDKDGLLEMCPTRIVSAYRLKNSGGCAILGSNCKDCRKAFWTEEV